MPATPWKKTLPWHFLGAIHTLIHSQPGKGDTLMVRLRALGPAPLCAALKADQSGDAAGGLLDHVFAVAATRSKEEYAWNRSDWPAELGVKLRRGIPDLLLTPEALYIPWPFPGDLPGPHGTYGLLEEARMKAHCDDLPSYGNEGSAKLYLYRFMKAADDATQADSGFPGSGSKQQQENWIAERAGTVTLPAKVAVYADQGRSSYTTHWAYRMGAADTELQLHLGLTREPTTCPPRDPGRGFLRWLIRLLRELLSLNQPRFDNWPDEYECK